MSLEHSSAHTSNVQITAAVGGPTLSVPGGNTAATPMPSQVQAPGAPAPTPSASSNFALKSAAEAIVVGGTLTFVSGWSYVSAYLTNFGFSVFDIDLSSSLLSTLAIHVLYRSPWPVYVIVGVTAALSIFRQVTRRELGANAMTAVAVVMLGIVIISLAIAGARLGRANATQDLHVSSSRLPTVAFDTELRGDYPDCVTRGVLSCRLLVHWKQAYFFFEPLTDQGADAPGDVYNVQLYVLPEAQVKFARLSIGQR